MKRSTEEFFSKKCTYQVENPLQIKSTSIRRTVDSRSQVEWKSEFNFLVMSNVGLSLAMTSTKKGHTTSSCILSEVTVLRNKRSEKVFFSRTNLTCFNLSMNLSFYMFIYSFYSDDKDTCVSYSGGSIDLFVS